jgi:ankyrin repeat protein
MLTMQDEEEFLEAIRKNDHEKVAQLLKDRPSLANTRDRDGGSAILMALYRGNKPIAAAIAAIKQTDIFEAACLGDLNQLKTLLSQDPSLAESYSPDGFTALALASYIGQKESVDILVEKGADVNAPARNSTGFTALTGAVSQNHNGIAKVLVARGAKVDHKYEGDFTPLMHAAHAGNIELVKLLLDHGADPNAKNSEGKTPLSFAVEKGHQDLVDLLKKHGAK